MNFKKLSILSMLLAYAQLSATAMTFIVGNTLDNGDNLAPIPYSLRAAILDSNANTGSFSNTIAFTVAGTITPLTDLPAITQTVLIDGYTAPGSYVNTNPLNMPNDAVITVELQGPGTGVNLSTLNGLVITYTSADGSIIRGLCINNFSNIDVPAFNDLVPGSGVLIESDNCTIEGCFIGTGIDGATPLPNAAGIQFYANNTTIGGVLLTTVTTDNAARNLIVGASYSGYAVMNGYTVGSGSTTIAGNTIGLARDGITIPSTGTNHGIYFAGGGLNLSNNVISGHTGSNLYLVYGVQTIVQQSITNNFIGTDITGTYATTDNGIGVYIIPELDLPGQFLIDGNTISGNTTGIFLAHPLYLPVIGAQITNNFIGTDATGTLAIPNTVDGIWLNKAVNTFIGSNVISNSGRNGITTAKAKNTIIKSNYIGTDVTGSVPMGNALNGIQLGTIVGVGVPSFGDIVGGALYGEGNLIANNGGYGIQVVSYTQQETIQGNTIVNNALDGIRLGPKSKNNWVGGFRNAGNNLLTGELQSQGYVNLGPLGTSNYIAQNGGYGISAVGSNGNAIQTNIVVDNGNDGITLVDSSDNLVGGKVALAKPAVEIPPVLGNIITGNGGFGVSVVVEKGKANNNTILSNEIFGNDDAGIVIE